MPEMETTHNQEDTKEVETVEEQAEETVREDEETLGDALDSETEVATPKAQKPKTVPIELFLELKKELKEAKKEKSNSSSVSDSTIDSIAKEYDVDPNFVGKLAKAIKDDTTREFEEKYSGKISELEKSTQKADREKRFNDLYKKTLSSYPWFKEVANKEVIMQLATNPSNAKKTLPQLLEEVYGNSVQGKKTMETTQPNSGEKGETVDFAQAGDPAVYARIKADPKLREQYNEYVRKNLDL